MTSDLDLFEWAASRPARQPATVHLFPLSRRARLIRQTAATLAGADIVKADRHWQSVLKRLRSELAGLHLSEEAEHRELLLFYRAVEARMHEGARQIQDHPTGGHAA